MRPRVDAAPLAAQPLAIEEVRAGQLGPQPGTRETLDRFSIETLGSVTLADEGTAARCESQTPVRTPILGYRL